MLNRLCDRETLHVVGKHALRRSVAIALHPPSLKSVRAERPRADEQPPAPADEQAAARASVPNRIQTQPDDHLCASDGALRCGCRVRMSVDGRRVVMFSA